MKRKDYDSEFARMALRNEIGQAVHEAMLRSRFVPCVPAVVADRSGRAVRDVLDLLRCEQDSIEVAVDCLRALGYRMHITIAPWHDGVRMPVVEANQ